MLWRAVGGWRTLERGASWRDVGGGRKGEERRRKEVAGREKMAKMREGARYERIFAKQIGCSEQNPNHNRAPPHLNSS